MSGFSYMRELAPKMLNYRMARHRWVRPAMPINLTFSVTNVCQSRCKTCRIWDLYRKHPEKRDEELTLHEVEEIFASIGHVYVFNISGGEPFLHPDLPGVVDLACRYLTPGVIHIPTNGIAVQKAEKDVRKILEIIRDHGRQVELTITVSYDHIGQKHDEVRGVKGNFEKILDLCRRLRAMKEEFPNLHVELGTIISVWNINDIEEIADYAMQLGCDAYRNEIAEQRAEMFNREDPIAPNVDSYEEAIQKFTRWIKIQMAEGTGFQRITSAFRLVYYDLAIRTMREQRQVVPCYAGVSNAHMTPYGDIWACCVLGDDQSMGNVRDFDYDFRKLWHSKQASGVRRHITGGNCSCPLANQSYSNILMNIRLFLRVLSYIVRVPPVGENGAAKPQKENLEADTSEKEKLPEAKITSHA